MGSEKNLENGVRITRETARSYQAKAVESRRRASLRKKTILQLMDQLDRLPLNEIGKNDLKRGGLDLAGVDPDDLNGAFGIVAGMYIAARRGNQKAFDSLARYRDQQKKDKLEIDKLKQEIKKLKKETEPENDNDQVMEFIEAMTNEKEKPDG